MLVSEYKISNFYINVQSQIMYYVCRRKF